MSGGASKFERPRAVESDKRESLLKSPSIRSLFILTFLGFTSFYLTLAALPAHAANSGIPESTAGAVTGSLLATTIVTQMCVPWLERRLGTRRLLATGMVALGLPTPLYMFCDGLGSMIAVSGVRGIGFGILTVIGAMLSSRESPQHRRGEAIGIYGLAIAIPNLFAVPAGTALEAYGGFSLVAALGVCPIFAVPLTGGFRPPAAVMQKVRSSTPKRGMSVARLAGVPSLVLLVVTLSGGGLLTFLPISQPTGAFASIALLCFGVGGAAGRWRVGSLADRIGSKVPLSFGLLLAALGLTSVALTFEYADTDGMLRLVACLGSLAFGIGYGMAQNLTQMIAFARAGDDVAAASTIWNIAFDSGTALGAYGIGLIAATGLQLTGTYLVCSALLAMSIPVALATRTRSV